MPDISSTWSDHDIPLLPNSISTIDPIASTSRLGEVQGFNHEANLAGAVPQMEKQGGGVNTEAVATNAEMQHVNGESGIKSIPTYSAPTRFPGLYQMYQRKAGQHTDACKNIETGKNTQAGEHTNTIDAVEDLAPLSCNQANNDASKDAEPDSDNPVTDLATLWCKPAEKLDHADNEASNEGEVDSDYPARDLAALWGKPAEKLDDAESQASNEAEVDSDNSVKDLASLWCKSAAPLNQADSKPSHEAEIDSVTDLAPVWCGYRMVTVAGGLNDADNENGNEAEVAGSNEANSHEDPSAMDMAVDTTTGVVSVTPSRITLTTRRQLFTGDDFEFVNASWLEPPPQDPPFDSDEEEDSDDGTNDANIYEDEDDGDEEDNDEDESEEEDEGESD